jgi:hypothetical protein
MSDAGENSVKGLLAQLLQIKPKRLAARNIDKWEEFHVNDSLATRIKVIENGNKETLDLMIGKFTYQQSNNPYGGQGNITGTTFVRLSDENEVYAVDGFVTMSVNREFNSWRNQQIANTRKENITKLIFTYPADTGFIALRNDSIWTVNGIAADSLKMDQFLSSLSYKNSSDFEDGFTPSSNPVFQLTIEGNNFSPISIQGFTLNNDQFVINSSVNPRSYFRSDKEGILTDLFKPLAYFLESE